jgi:hypothetical protein
MTMAEEKKVMKKYVALEKVYVNDTIYEAGQEFLYDGEPGKSIQLVVTKDAAKK